MCHGKTDQVTDFVSTNFMDKYWTTVFTKPISWIAKAKMTVYFLEEFCIGFFGF